MARARTPWRRAGDAVVELGELLSAGVRHQVLGLDGRHGRPAGEEGKAKGAGRGQFAVQ